MDIFRTGVIECAHAPGECRSCPNRLEQRCRAPQQEPCAEECRCPQREGVGQDEGYRTYRVNAVFSHDCPIHGRDIDGPRDPRATPS